MASGSSDSHSKKSQSPADKSKLIQKLLSNAQFYVEQELYEEAETAYREILELYRDNPEALAGLQQLRKKRQAQEHVSLPETDSISASGWQRYLKTHQSLVALLATLAVMAMILGAWFSPNFIGESAATTGSPEKASGEGSAAANPLPAENTSSQFKNDVQIFSSPGDSGTSESGNLAPTVAGGSREDDRSAHLPSQNQTASPTESLSETSPANARDFPASKQPQPRKSLPAATSPADSSPTAKTAEGIASLQEELAAARQSARQARQGADQAEAPELAREAYDDAQNRLQNANDLTKADSLTGEQLRETVALYREAGQRFERAHHEAISVTKAKDLYQKFEYRKGLDTLKTVFREIPYPGENVRARELQEKIVAAQKVRTETLGAARQKTAAGDLLGALEILRQFPQQDDPAIREAIEKVFSRDRLAPEIMPHPSEPFPLYRPLFISLTVRDNLAVKQVKLHYRRKDEPDYREMKLPGAASGEYRFTISPEYHQGEDIYYYFSAEDIGGLQSRYRSREHPLRATVSQPEIQGPN